MRPRRARRRRPCIESVAASGGPQIVLESGSDVVGPLRGGCDLIQSREEVVAASPLREILSELGLGMQVARGPEDLVEEVARVAMGERHLDVLGQMLDQELQD